MIYKTYDKKRNQSFACTHIATIFMLVLLSATAYATEQSSDLLIYNSDTILIESYPLETLMESDSVLRNKIFNYSDTVSCISSGCWRGHIATWTIKNDSLFLINLISGCKDHQFKLEEVFETGLIKNKKVFAGWYTGKLLESRGWFEPEADKDPDKFSCKIVNGKAEGLNSDKKQPTKTFTIYINTSSFYLRPDCCQDWKWEINNKELSFEKDSINVVSNFPKFDTVYFQISDTIVKELILTRFRPGRTYQLNYNICCQYFDFRDKANSELYKNLNEGEYLDTVNSIESGTVQFVIKNYYGNDPVIGLYGDIFAPFSSGVQIHNDELSQKATAFVTGYSGFVHHIVIGKAIIESDSLYSDDETTNRIMLGDDKIAQFTEQLFSIRFRFLNQENLVVIYDYKENKVELLIDE